MRDDRSVENDRAARETEADVRAADLVGKMAMAEKVQLLQGEIFLRVNLETGQPEKTPGSLGGDGYVQGIERLGLPDLQIIGSGLGVTNLGKRANGSATAFPSSLATAASWSDELAYDVGVVIGRQTRDQGFNVSIGGGANLTRDAWGGRNFEYHGEDPVLSGRLVARTLRGTEDQGVVATIKHYALNPQETGRMVANSRIGERELRESDLLAFEIGIRDSGVGCVMGAYNRLNGPYCCENPYLLNDVLKGEWGFRGWVVSDWGATHSTVEAANGGLDQEIPQPRFFGDELVAAVERGEVSRERLDDMVHRILRTTIAVGVVDDPPSPRPIDREAGAVAARRAAEQGTVLLKNEGGLLPLDGEATSKIAVIGGHADRAVLSGGGSSQVEPPGGNVIPPENPPPGPVDFKSPVWLGPAPLEGIAARATEAQIGFTDGSDPEAAAALARESDVAVVFATQHRGEEQDVASLSLGDEQEGLISAVAAANPLTVVVLETGGAVLTPWADEVPALLAAWYPGERAAEALAGILFGDVNPSGKLPLTFPVSEDDLPRPRPVGYEKTNDGQDDLTEPFDIDYVEGANVGYRWFDVRDIEPRFPFGFGLSYSEFGYDDLHVEADGGVRASFSITNTGERAGFEVAQVYVELPQGVSENSRRLAGWARVYLEPGQTRSVTVALEPLALAVWDVGEGSWRVPSGDFRIAAGRSSRDLPLSATVPLSPDALPSLLGFRRSQDR